MTISLISNIVSNVNGVVTIIPFDNSDLLESANSNSEGYIVPEGTYLIDRSISISVPITMLPGAKFLISTGVTLTITRSFDAGLYHCFIGEGNVIFQRGSVKEVFIQWYGAVSNISSSVIANDISQALIKALNSYSVVNIPRGSYYLSNTVTIDKPSVINLEGGTSDTVVGSRYELVGRNQFTGELFYLDNSHFVPDSTAAVIYTDKNIDFFIITSGHVYIDGGVFDATLATSIKDNHAVFHYIPSIRGNVPPFLDGQMEGSITNFVIKGGIINLVAGAYPANIDNSITGIYLDWENAEDNSFLYRHKWQGWFYNVKYCLYETAEANILASNTCWHIIDFQVWIAKQALVMNRSTECDINISFQSAPILNTSEKDLAVIYFKGVYGHKVKARFVDMLASQTTDPESIYYLGWSHTYSVEDWTGRNFYERMNTDVDLLYRLWKNVGAAPNGISIAYADRMSGVLPSGQFSSLYEGFRSAYYSNAIVAANKRYTTSVGYYKKPAGVPFTDITVSSADYPCTPSSDIEGQFLENLWTAHTAFTEFFWRPTAADTDYVEIVIDNIDISGIRYNQIHLTGSSSLSTEGGLRQIHIVQICNGPVGEEVSKNEIINCEPAFVRSLNYSIILSETYQVKKLIIRLIGQHYKLNSITQANLTNNTLAQPGSLANNTPIFFTTVGTITGISANVLYYVVNSAYDIPLNLHTFKVSLTEGGDAIDLGGSTSTLPIWTYGIRSFNIAEFSIFKNGPAATNEIYASTAPLVAISGNQQIYGSMSVAGTTNSPADLTVGDGAWNGTGLLRLGIYRLWVDPLGKLRIKNDNPIGPTDGDIVGDYGF
jgi:hypothetical protein